MGHVVGGLLAVLVMVAATLVCTMQFGDLSPTPKPRSGDGVLIVHTALVSVPVLAELVGLIPAHNRFQAYRRKESAITRNRCSIIRSLTRLESIGKQAWRARDQNRSAELCGQA